MKAGDDPGLRVNDIAKRACLSRPAVSRHLKVLKDSKVVQIRKEGTKNYYYYDPDEDGLELLLKLLKSGKDLKLEIPEKNNRD